MRTAADAIREPMPGDRWEGLVRKKTVTKIVHQVKGRWLSVETVGELVLLWPSIYTFRRWAATAQFLGGKT